VRAEIIQAFIGAAREVLLQEMGDPVEPGKPRLQGGPYKVGDITVVVGLAKAVEGAILLGISKSTATQYLSHVMGEPVDELDELALSGIGELGNMIAGMAAARLSEQGHEAIIAPPTLFVGGGGILTTLNVQRLVVAVETPFGTIELQLAAQVHN